MGIQDAASTAPAPQSQPTGRAPQATMNECYTNQPQTDTGLNIFNLGSGFMSRKPASESLTTALEILRKRLSTATLSDVEITLLPLDAAKETDVIMSAIIVVGRFKNEPAFGLSYHTLSLEGSSEPIPPKVEHYNGTPYEIRRVASDAHDQIYARTVKKIVMQAFPNEKELRSNEGAVVPRGFNWEDIPAVDELLNNAVVPVDTDLRLRKAGTSSINLKQLLRGVQAQMVVTMRFNEPQRNDYVRLPIRSDVTLTLTAISGNKQASNSVNAQEKAYPLTHVSGFIDALWNPRQQQQMVYGMMMALPTPKFAPRYVITRMEAETAISLELQLLALVTSTALGEAGNWYAYYNQRGLPTSGSQIDLRDPGAFNIEANIGAQPGGPAYGQIVDTKSADFDITKRLAYLSQIFQQEMVFSLDVSDAGSDTWMNGAFRAAALGNKDAWLAILNAANTLTGGEFERIYNCTDNPVYDNAVDAIQLGYYEDATGQRRDLRDVDYLAVANVLGPNDPTAMAVWTDSFQNLRTPLPVRLANRLRLIQSVARGNVTVTGMGVRVTFRPEFLNALRTAAKNAGLVTTTHNAGAGQEFMHQRADAGFLSGAGLASQPIGLFSGGMWNPQGSAAAVGGWNAFVGGHYNR